MSDNAPLLTIAIPTYSRAHFLEGLLEGLFDQLVVETRVELLISDNASTDNTQSLISSFRARGLAIRSIRNETNLGADRNILQCYLQASGTYVWVFSDDDLILPGAVERVLGVLAPGIYDVVALNARNYQEDGTQYAAEKYSSSDRELRRPEELARRVHVFFTFISGIILHKARVSAMPHQPFESLIDTNLVQLGPVYSALNCHRRSLLVREPLIAARGNSNVGYALYRVFGTQFERITSDWVESPAVRRAILNGTIRKFLPDWIMKSRESRASSVSENPHAILRKCYGNNMRYWLFNYPIYALPIPLAKAWWIGVKIVNKLDSVIGGLLLKS